MLTAEDEDIYLSISHSLTLYIHICMYTTYTCMYRFVFFFYFLSAGFIFAVFFALILARKNWRIIMDICIGDIRGGGVKGSFTHTHTHTPMSSSSLPPCLLPVQGLGMVQGQDSEIRFPIEIPERERKRQRERLKVSGWPESNRNRHGSRIQRQTAQSWLDSYSCPNNRNRSRFPLVPYDKTRSFIVSPSSLQQSHLANVRFGSRLLAKKIIPRCYRSVHFHTIPPYPLLLDPKRPKHIDDFFRLFSELNSGV